MIRADQFEMEIEASVENLPEVMAFVEEKLEAFDCPMKTEMQICVAVEEIFVNIANYAYAPGTGTASISLLFSPDRSAVTIAFSDRGVPYDPLAKEDPDVTLSAEERGVGGLGIFMTKKAMDEITYEYKDNRNILSMRKYLK